jgi:hypothetical protein
MRRETACSRLSRRDEQTKNIDHLHIHSLSRRIRRRAAGCSSHIKPGAQKFIGAKGILISWNMLRIQNTATRAKQLWTSEEGDLFTENEPVDDRSS